MQRIKLGAQDGLHGIFHHLDALQKWESGQDFPPLWVEISPTDACNHRCFFCYLNQVEHKSAQIPESLLIKISRDMGASGVKCCEFQGTGEPLLNEGTPNAIVAGKRSGMDICLVTNGVLLNRDILEKVEPCLSFLRVSALAHNAQFYARLHGCPMADFGLVVKALEEAARIRDRQKLAVVIVATFITFNFNTPYIADTARLLKDIGVDLMSVKPAVNIGHNQSWERDSLHRKHKDKFTEAKAIQDERFKIFLNEGYLDEFMSVEPPPRNYRMCYGVEFETHIGANAKIYPCARFWGNERYCLGDLSEGAFGKVWRSAQWHKVLSQFYNEIRVDECGYFCCKQHSINRYLYEMANPQRHVNVI